MINVFSVLIPKQTILLQEDCPLASLPLLGYTITTPSEKDGIQKDFVFKLQFKNHIYFFRAESEYPFNRYDPSGHFNRLETALQSFELISFCYPQVDGSYR